MTGEVVIGAYAAGKVLARLLFNEVIYFFSGELTRIPIDSISDNRFFSGEQTRISVDSISDNLRMCIARTYEAKSGLPLQGARWFG